MKVSHIVKEGIGIDLKLIPRRNDSSVLAHLLIPYLNVGTTIALVALPAAMSRGEAISPTEILIRYRKNMAISFCLWFAIPWQ